jgi:hypothetical protein
LDEYRKDGKLTLEYTDKEIFEEHIGSYFAKGVDPGYPQGAPLQVNIMMGILIVDVSYALCALCVSAVFKKDL